VPAPPAPSTPAIFAVGAGPGGLPVVDVFDSATGVFKFQFQAFETGFTGGLRVAVARSNGQDFIAVAAGPGGFLVRTFVVSGNSAALVGQFTPFGTITNGVYSGFTGGIYVALGDLRGDGQLEVVTAPDAAPNSNPFFNVWSLDGKTQLSPNVFAFEKGFTGGVRVAVGDVDGSGRNEIIAAAGPGGFPFVDVINGQTFALVRRFQVFNTGFMGGVTVAAGTFDASGMARILVGADGGDNAPWDAPVMRTFDNNGSLLTDYVFAFEQSYHGGVNVATTLDSRARAWVLATPARAHAPQVNIFSASFSLLQNQTITDPKTLLADANFANGASVGG
jgi:serralysin